MNRIVSLCCRHQRFKQGPLRTDGIAPLRRAEHRMQLGDRQDVKLAPRARLASTCCSITVSLVLKNRRWCPSGLAACVVASCDHACSAGDHASGPYQRRHFPVNKLRKERDAVGTELPCFPLCCQDAAVVNQVAGQDLCGITFRSAFRSLIRRTGAATWPSDLIEGGAAVSGGLAGR